MEICRDCAANPGASTTRRYCPSARCGNVAVPLPAVVCTPTPALSPMRNKLICTPETRSPAGLSTDTLKSDAKAAVQHSSATRNPRTTVKRRTLDMTLFLYTRQGLVIRALPSHAKSACAGAPVVRAGLLARELRFASRTTAVALSLIHISEPT